MWSGRHEGLVGGGLGGCCGSGNPPRSFCTALKNEACPRCMLLCMRLNNHVSPASHSCSPPHELNTPKLRFVLKVGVGAALWREHMFKHEAAAQCKISKSLLHLFCCMWHVFNENGWNQSHSLTVAHREKTSIFAACVALSECIDRQFILKWGKKWFSSLTLVTLSCTTRYAQNASYIRLLNTPYYCCNHSAVWTREHTACVRPSVQHSLGCTFHIVYLCT